MMPVRASTFAATVSLALAACSQAGEEQSADDFANRVGANGQATGPSQAEVEAQAAQPNAPAAQIPSGADPKQLERLGDIGMVDLGTRQGGCTFQELGREILYTSGNDQSGKGVVRIGGELITVDASGGLSAIRAGTTFSTQGVSISVAPTAGNEARRAANMVVTDSAGTTQSYSGDWICG
ncbi:hypothetical protein [Erythrobacter litoralis]|uniref:Lipoprotein n=1 Tax=Erythrobacter litoralis (strain HTCC2594) TaxID=314225 RepID=Q2NA63_ERYLH|nr:hypothetical protein [Erythrobacter litoralis]ABC63428.1 hypothetical protein ELI_06680 [Erythrobacter litoralis HTCC2594]